VFGDTPIGAYQSIQHPLADVAVMLQAARLMTYRSALLFDQGGEVSDLAESANSAKYLAAELASRAVDAAIDTFGGKGFDEDHGVIHLWEAARLLKTAPISNALILNQLAERHLELPRSY
jgi:alkylation response protein AidB-like acyl-CoA dehydrogenase